MDSTDKKTDMKKDDNPVYSNTDTSKVVLSEAEWKKILPQDVYYIARQKGTERPWTSKFEKFDETRRIAEIAAADAEDIKELEELEKEQKTS